MLYIDKNADFAHNKLVGRWDRRKSGGEMDMTKCGRRMGAVLALALLWAALTAGPAWAADRVCRAELDGEISDYMVSYLERAYAEAEEQGADALLLDLDTYGGYVTAAVEIKQLIMDADVPTYCYVNDKAISAGALIALSCDRIVMKHGGSIGAAEPRQGAEKADEKVVSFWTAQLAAAAEENGRNADVARAMSDSAVVIEGLTESGKLLTLTSAEALKWQMVDDVAESDADALYQLGIDGAEIVDIEYNLQENGARVLGNSVVSTVLLAVGIGSLVLEAMFAGVGIFAALGVVSLALYFIGALLVSYTAWIAVALAFAGLVLLIMEIFVIPGFGVCGVLGIASIIGAVVCAAPSLTLAMVQLGVALLAAVVLIIISLKCGKTRRVWSKLILREATTTEGGYVSQPGGINALVGKTGVTLTDLRPSGAALIDDKRTDVLSEGRFIKRGTYVIVIRVEGSSVVVRSLENELEEETKAAE